MTKDIRRIMQRLSIEIVNVDEAIAEDAVNTLIDALSHIVEPIKKSLKVEPHDDARGIWATIELKTHAMSSSSAYKQSVVASAKALLNLQFHHVTKATVHVTLTAEKGEIQ
jgi:hypothetical protein